MPAVCQCSLNPDLTESRESRHGSLVGAPRGKSDTQPQLGQLLIVTRPNRLQMLMGISQVSNGLQRETLSPLPKWAPQPITQWCRKPLLATIKPNPWNPRFQQTTQYRFTRPRNGRFSLSMGQRPSGGVDRFGQEWGAHLQSRIHGRAVHLDQQIAR